MTYICVVINPYLFLMYLSLQKVFNLGDLLLLLLVVSITCYCTIKFITINGNFVDLYLLPYMKTVRGKATFMYVSVAVLLSLMLFFEGCKKELQVQQAHKYKTESVFILVVDGARYTETWGDTSRQYIPHRAALLQEGVCCTEFYNNAFTVTCPGHQAMCTGVYENINNSGNQYPTNPSFFQYWRKLFNRPATEAWVVATKDKLEVLSDCVNQKWKGKYRPSTDCGVSGLFSGYREDSVTFNRLKSIASANHIRMAIVNFKQPDAAGHAADSMAYLQGILDTDNYIYQFWNFLQSNPLYKDKSTLIVTNDHGRHTAGHLDGFVSHGDTCDGCRHIEFFALGPDFKKNYTCNVPYEQVDIASTISELMGFAIPTGKGKVMQDIFIR